MALKKATEKTTNAAALRNKTNEDKLLRMREHNRYAQEMDVSTASYYDSERKMRLRKLIDGRCDYRTIGDTSASKEKRSLS